MRKKMQRPRWYVNTSLSFRHVSWKPYFKIQRLWWKDKFETPRCERTPSLCFAWLGFGIYIERGCDEYWEQWLWVNKYHGGDYQKAKEEWPWLSMDTEKSTWKDTF